MTKLEGLVQKTKTETLTPEEAEALALALLELELHRAREVTRRILAVWSDG
jgi:hypothetical protein